MRVGRQARVVNPRATTLVKWAESRTGAKVARQHRRGRRRIKTLGFGKDFRPLALSPLDYQRPRTKVQGSQLY